MRLVFNIKNKDTFKALKDGTKKAETRAATVKFQNIKKGDIITFACDGEVFEKMVSKINYFKTIEEVFGMYKPSDINPKLKTKKETIDMWYSYPNYEFKIKEFGLVAFELE